MTILFYDSLLSNSPPHIENAKDCFTCSRYNEYFNSRIYYDKNILTEFCEVTIQNIEFCEK